MCLHAPVQGRTHGAVARSKILSSAGRSMIAGFMRTPSGSCTGVRSKAMVFAPITPLPGKTGCTQSAVTTASFLMHDRKMVVAVKCLDLQCATAVKPWSIGNAAPVAQADVLGASTVRAYRYKPSRCKPNLWHNSTSSCQVAKNTSKAASRVCVSRW